MKDKDYSDRRISFMRPPIKVKRYDSLGAFQYWQKLREEKRLLPNHVNA